MSIRKRSNGVYFVDITTASGERVRRSTGTVERKAAQEYHDKLKHELWRTSRLGEKPVRTFKEAAERFLKEQAHLANFANVEAQILWFGEKLGERDLAGITRDDIIKALPQSDNRVTRETKPLSNATRNRYLAAIGTLLNMAVKSWEWLDRAPTIKKYKEPGKRVRWISRDEARNLLKAIKQDWMRDIAILGFATGLRQANLLELEWSQVDLVKRRAWIHPDQAKARKPIGVPLNEEAVQVIRRQLGKHERFVFVRNGSPVKCWDSIQWNAACKRAGIANFRFHDVRHTWASWHVQNGTPLNLLMELGGWASYSMVLRYAHLAPDHLAAHADALGTIWAQETPELVAIAGGKPAA